jgi:hypothetical protein
LCPLTVAMSLNPMKYIESPAAGWLLYGVSVSQFGPIPHVPFTASNAIINRLFSPIDLNPFIKKQQILKPKK